MATQPTATEQTTTTIPGYAKPYAQQLLGSVFGGQVGSEFIPGLIGQGYQPYGRQRTAGFSPMQQQAFERYAGMQVSPELREAAGLASLAGRQSGQLGMSYQPMQYQPTNVSYMGTQAPQLQQYQMGPAERVGADRFGSQAMQDYMSPYMSGVVAQQKRGAMQDFARQMPGLRASAARSGALGGTRESLMRSEAQRNLQGQLQGIEATGLQSAFQQAQQQFGADRAAQMQAALANQQAGLTTGQQNLAAQLGTQQLGAGQSLQSQQLNQAAQLQAQQQALGQNQAAQQAVEQSRQFGAGLGMQGLQQQLAAAGTLGQLGQTQFNQQQMASQAQQQSGAQMQQLEQQRLQMSYEDFLNRQRYPYQQLGFMSDLIRGTPTGGGVQSLYGAQTSPLGAVAGLGGLYMANKGG